MPATAADAPDGAGTVAWSVTPVISAGAARSNFTYTVEPGQQIKDAALVRNSGADPLTVQVYAADAFITEDGRLDLQTQEAGSQDLGTWVAVSAPALTVPPGEQRRVDFTLTVPDDAVPGDHAGALLTSITQAGSGADGGALDVDMRYATRITARVSGELAPGLAVVDQAVDYSPSFWPWDDGAATVTYTVENTGNTRVSARQAIALAGPFGLGEQTVESSPDGATVLADVPELLPGTSLDLTARIDGVPSWLLHADADLMTVPETVDVPGAAPATIEPIELSVSDWAVSPGIWVLLAGLVLVIVYAIRRVRGARKARKSVPGSGPDAAGDAVENAPAENDLSPSRARG